MKNKNSNKTYFKITRTILERFGEPIGKATATVGIPDERDSLDEIGGERDYEECRWCGHTFHGESDDASDQVNVCKYCAEEESLQEIGGERDYEECRWCGETFHGESDDASDKVNVCKYCAEEDINEITDKDYDACPTCKKMPESIDRKHVCIIEKKSEITNEAEAMCIPPPRGMDMEDEYNVKIPKNANIPREPSEDEVEDYENRLQQAALRDKITVAPPKRRKSLSNF